MHSLEKHYNEIIQQDLILTSNLSTVALLPKQEKVKLCLGGNSAEDSYVLGCLAALNIITGQKPIFTQQQLVEHGNNTSREVVGGKIILRRSRMYGFLEKLLLEVLPNAKQFEGLRAPSHNSIYCFTLKDMFTFHELVPLFPYFEELSSLQCQFYFTTKTEADVVVLGNSLQLCFLPKKS